MTSPAQQHARFLWGGMHVTSIATTHHYGTPLQHYRPLVPIIPVFSNLGPGISQYQFVREKGNARVRNDTNQGNGQAGIESHHAFLRINSSTGLHETNATGPGIHHATPNDFVRITDHGRCHFTQSRGQQQVYGGLLFLVVPKGLFELFVNGKLNGRVRQSHEIGRHTSPKHCGSTLGVQRLGRLNHTRRWSSHLTSC
jgi:hypothetical protein